MAEAVAILADEADIEPELAEIAGLCAGMVRYMVEGGRHYVHMVGLRFLAQGTEKQMDALLCLDYPNASYPTKLYLPESLGLGLNWNENAYILARQWFTWSWRDVSPQQPPIAVLAEHLRAFQ